MRHEVQVEVISELMQQLDSKTTADAGGILKCPTDTYTSQDRLDQEWQTFFQNHAQIIGMSGDLPEAGSFITSNDLGVPILATRTKNGEFRAFLNACRHRGPKVEHERRGKKHSFSCMFHAWTYANSGELVGVPREDLFGVLDKSCNGLIELPCLEQYGFLWVHPNPKGKIDSDEIFEGLHDDFSHWGWQDYEYKNEFSYDMRLNWKLATDTFGETYHFSRLHKNTLAQSFYGDVLSYRHWQKNHRMILCRKSIDDLRAQPQENWSIYKAGFPVYFVYPNVVVNVGDRQVVVVRVYPDPKDPGRSISKIGIYSQEPDTASTAEGPDQSLGEAFSAVVEAEDYWLAQSTQEAAEAGLMEHVIFGRNEPPLHHYHQTFRKALGLPPLELHQEA